MPVRYILYVHGLESGPQGRKARYLHRHFGSSYTVIVPDQQISLLNVSKSNAILRFRHLLTLQPVTAAITSCAHLIISEVASMAEREGKSVAEVGESLAVVASSWGGAVVVCAIRDMGLRPQRVLLLAPALAAKGCLGSVLLPCPSSFERAELLPSDFDPTRVTLIHGSGDDTVPVEASRKFKEAFPEVDYREISGADHSLTTALGIRGAADFHPAFTLRQIVAERIQEVK